MAEIMTAEEKELFSKLLEKQKAEDKANRDKLRSNVLSYIKKNYKIDSFGELKTIIEKAKMYDELMEKYKAKSDEDKAKLIKHLTSDKQVKYYTNVTATEQFSYDTTTTY